MTRKLTFQNGLSFKPKEVLIFGSTHMVTSGDTVNFIMFFISLTTMYIAMYHSRLKEARNTHGLHMAADELERKHKEAHEQFIQATEALASAIDAKDKYTNGHSRRVAEYSAKIAKAAGKSEEECERIYFAALFHDVGKIAIPLDILTKKGRLTNEEFARIKEHPDAGGSILANINQSPWLSDGARYHHERYDGTGYPEGLKGEAIPEIGRIIGYAAFSSNVCRQIGSCIFARTAQRQSSDMVDLLAVWRYISTTTHINAAFRCRILRERIYPYIPRRPFRIRTQSSL